VEREQLKQMMKTHHPLLEKCSLHPPDAIELSALCEQTLERLEAELDAFFIHAGEEKKS